MCKKQYFLYKWQLSGFFHTFYRTFLSFCCYKIAQMAKNPGPVNPCSLDCLDGWTPLCGMYSTWKTVSLLTSSSIVLCSLVLGLVLQLDLHIETVFKCTYICTLSHPCHILLNCLPITNEMISNTKQFIRQGSHPP